MTTITINAGSLKVLQKLEDAAKDTTPLMKQLGALNVEASQNAFDEQKLGKTLWQPRYPGMRPPFLNIAGALQDFNAGKKAPKPNRFQDRPALIDEGMRGGLKGSISFQVVNPTTEVTGSAKPYASLQHGGGRTSILITKQAKASIADWLWTKKGKSRKGREGYESKLGPLTLPGRDSLEQKVIARPFIGITDELVGDFTSAIMNYFQKKAGA